MKHPSQVILELRDASGTLDKKAILLENENNTLLKEVLRLTYDTSYNYYTTVIPKVTQAVKSLNSLAYAMEIMTTQLATRKVTGNAAKQLVSELFHTLSQEDRDCLGYIIRRDVKAGISAKTILTIWPTLFPYHPYMRCSVKGEVDYPAISQLKGDGIFSRWFVDNPDNTVRAITRNGTPLLQIEKISQVLSKMPVGVYEGELTIRDNSGEDLPREIGNGIINSVFIHGKKSYEEAVGKLGYKVHLMLWDTVTHEEYTSRLSKTPCSIRLDMITEYLREADFGSKWVSPVTYKFVNNKQEATEHYLAMRSLGKEGTILKAMSAVWKDGTSKDQIKLKVEEVVELTCVGFNQAAEGSKNSDTFGSILFESSCGKLSVSATGFTDELRESIWSSKEYYLGKVASVKANGVMPPSKTNQKHSLFLPNFVEWRDAEKSNANSLDEILEVFNG